MIENPYPIFEYQQFVENVNLQYVNFEVRFSANFDKKTRVSDLRKAIIHFAETVKFKNYLKKEFTEDEDAKTIKELTEKSIITTSI